jgi:hypothetical protein
VVELLMEMLPAAAAELWWSVAVIPVVVVEDLLVEDVVVVDLLVVPSPLVDLMIPMVVVGLQQVEWSPLVESS